MSINRKIVFNACAKEVFEANDNLIREHEAGIDISISGVEINFFLSEAKIFALIYKNNFKNLTLSWESLIALIQQFQPDSFSHRFVKDFGGEKVEKTNCDLVQFETRLFDIQIDEHITKELNNFFSYFVDLLENVFSENPISEGQSYDAQIKRYERSKILREQAISIHGSCCKICSFSFEKIYGDIGKSYIHVHHLERVADKGVRFVDPARDLIPVCPNCHAMLHRKTPPLTPNELMEKMNEIKTR